MSNSRFNLPKLDFKKPYGAAKRRNSEDETPKNANIQRKPSQASQCSEKENIRRQLRRDLSDSNLSLVMKDAANKTLTTVKTAFDNISDKLRRSTRRPRVMTGSTYNSLENNGGGETPVKLYSPFGISTPSPRTLTKDEKGEITPGKRGRFTPRRFDFNSPTGKLRKDISDISIGIDDLNVVAKRVQQRSKRNVK